MTESQKILEALLSADPDSWAARLARAGQKRRTERHSGLAQGELEDGLYGSPSEPLTAHLQAEVRLAADDGSGPRFFGAGPWRTRVEPAPEGGHFVYLWGPADARLAGEALTVGRWCRVSGWREPVLLEVAGGTVELHPEATEAG